MSGPAESLREVAVPLGSLCREALAARPDDPSPVLAALFVERYGDEGDLFHDFCRAQYDLSHGPDVWQELAERNTVAVIAIRDDMLAEAGAGTQETYVVEGGDLSRIPADLRPMVEEALARRQAGTLDFQPVLPPTVVERRRRHWYRWRLAGLLACLAASLWLWSRQ